jgi:glycosyltransferase involved in cell wall biosynthesis
MEAVKKIVYIANARLPTEKAHGFQICKMCEAFARNGAEVELWHPSRKQSHLRGKNIFDYYGILKLFRVKTVGNFDVVRFEPFFPKSIFKFIFFLHALIWGLCVAIAARNQKADLYFTRDSQVGFWLVWLGLPTVYEGHLTPRRWQRRLVMATAKKPTLKLVVALADSIRQDFVYMGVPSEKVVVQVHGVDLALFQDLPTKRECRLRLSLPEGRPIVGYIGRFEAVGLEKGIPDLVRAMKSLPSVDGIEPLLLCVGGPMNSVPEYYDLALRIGIAEKRLLFMDRVPNWEVPYWIRACDVVLLPLSQKFASDAGMMPLKLFEYMAAEVPIMASDLPSIREILRHGDNAWLVEPGSPKALAEGVVSVLSDPLLCTRIANQAHEEAKKYSWENRASEILRNVKL